jgi:Protein of unknown function (DUF3768)
VPIAHAIALKFHINFRRSTMSERIDQICALNDQLRQTLTTGLVVITPGVAALGAEPLERIVKTVSVYDDFCRANDPHEEHDFGVFEADGQTIFFKIDYYDNSLSHHSPDPVDPSVTKRVITIMLSEEY